MTTKIRKKRKDNKHKPIITALPKFSKQAVEPEAHEIEIACDEKYRAKIQWTPLLIVGFVIVLLLGIFLRGYGLTKPANNDFKGWTYCATAVENGGNFYLDEGLAYNYGPAWAYTTAFLLRIARYISQDDILSLWLNFRHLVWSVLTAADILIFLLLFRNFGLLIGALFFLNPASFMLTGTHHQIDNIAVMAGLYSMWAYDKARDRNSTRLKFASFVLLGISLIFKHIFFVFPLYLAIKERKWSWRCLCLFIPYAVFGMSFVPFLYGDGLSKIIENVFQYQSTANSPLLHALLPNELISHINPKLVFFCALTGFAYIFRKRRGLETAALYTLVMVIFSPSVAGQYFAIPVAAMAIFINPFYIASAAVIALQELYLLWIFYEVGQYIPYYEHALKSVQNGMPNIYATFLGLAFTAFPHQPYEFGIPANYQLPIVLLFFGFLWTLLSPRIRAGWRNCAKNRKFIAGGAIVLFAVLGAGCQERLPAAIRPWASFVDELDNSAQIATITDNKMTIMSGRITAGHTNAKWLILADLEGPGCVRHLSLTGLNEESKVRVFFDGEKKARLRGTLQSVIGRQFPLIYPLAQSLNGCWSSYVPLSFRYSLRIEVEAAAVNNLTGTPIYSFELERFPGENIETFPKRFSMLDNDAVERVAISWKKSLQWPKQFTSNAQQFQLEPGQSKVIYEENGKGTLTQWGIDIRPAHKDEWNQKEIEYLLQDVRIDVFYDGMKYPSISCPVGDLFCNGWRRRFYGSLIQGSGPDGYFSAMPLPFRKGIRVELTNAADRNIDGSFFAITSSICAKNAGYLHAQFNKTDTKNGQRHTIGSYKGRGRYIGCFMGTTAKDENWQIIGAQASMLLDGTDVYSEQPLRIDQYFNEATANRGFVAAPLFGVMDCYPGHAAQYRFHLGDSLCFSNEFELVVDQGIKHKGEGVIRSVSFAYLATPTQIPSVPSARSWVRATRSPFERDTLMQQLIELERMNNFEQARSLLREWQESYLDASTAGILALRDLEYQRLIDPRAVSVDKYIAFARGDYGEEAETAAKLLLWFYSNPIHCLVGCSANAQISVLLNAADKTYNNRKGGGTLFSSNGWPDQFVVTGCILPENQPHYIAMRAMYTKSPGWVQLGVRYKNSVYGTGPEIYTLTGHQPGAEWYTGFECSTTYWKPVGSCELVSGRPKSTRYIAMKPNAFILLQSKSYPISGHDWDSLKGLCYISLPFQVPLTNMPVKSQAVTGLPQ